MVAINPYEDCSNLYGEDVVHVFRNQGSNVRSLIPHVFSVAEEAVHDMREYENNQSIIVSGESGAGRKCAEIARKMCSQKKRDFLTTNFSCFFAQIPVF